MLAFRSLDPFRALREPDRRRRDEERLSRSEQRTLSKTQNNHLTGKAPYKSRANSTRRLRQPASLRATRPHRRQPYWHAQEIRPRPMKNRSRGHRLLPVAGAALVNPRSSLQPPSHPAAAARTHKTAGPAKPGQVFDAPLLRPKPRCKIQKPSHPTPSLIDQATLPQGETRNYGDPGNRVGKLISAPL